MNELVALFVKKKITFVGSKKDYEEYVSGTGYAVNIENNLSTLITTG